MLNEKLPPIEGELTDEDLKLVCGGTPPAPTNGTGGHGHHGHHHRHHHGHGGGHGVVLSGGDS